MNRYLSNGSTAEIVVNAPLDIPADPVPSADDEHGRVVCRSTDDGTNFEDDEEGEECPLPLVSSVRGTGRRSGYLDGELAIDFARQGLQSCATELVGAPVPNTSQIITYKCEGESRYTTQHQSMNQTAM